MYIPSQFSENRPEVLHRLVNDYPLGTLVVMAESGLIANHIPFQLCPVNNGAGGKLRGHIARANPLWLERETIAHVMVIFQGPSAYVSPAYYPSKTKNPKVVPTWNYAVVHVNGRLKFVDDTDWLLSLVTGLTDAHESNQRNPWRVTDAPDVYVGAMLKAIVGIEIEITELIGKWKISQNRSEQDRDGVERSLTGSKCAETKALGDLMTQMSSWDDE